MADAAQLMEAFREELVDAGIARAPTVAGPLPPVWLAPEGGANAPSDKQGVENNNDLVLSVFYAGGQAMRPFESFWRRSTVDVVFRARKAPMAMECEALIREHFVGDLGRYEWSMGGLNMHCTLEWRALQPAPSTGPGHAFVWSMFAEFDA